MAGSQSRFYHKSWKIQKTNQKKHIKTENTEFFRQIHVMLCHSPSALTFSRRPIILTARTLNQTWQSKHLLPCMNKVVMPQLFTPRDYVIDTDTTSSSFLTTLGLWSIQTMVLIFLNDKIYSRLNTESVAFVSLPGFRFLHFVFSIPLPHPYAWFPCLLQPRRLKFQFFDLFIF